MSASRNVESAGSGSRLPWGDILLSSITAVSWALIGMAGTAALGLHLLEADSAGSLGPMTAAVVALGAGGSVTPSGDVSAFGLTGAQAVTAIEITPLGVSLVGAVLLSYFFLRSLRGAGVVIAPAELLARAGAVLALSVAVLGGLAWAGHDVITIDGGSLGLDDLPGAGAAAGGVEIPGIGDIGGLLPDRIGDLIDAKAAVGFTVDTAPTLLGGLGWSAGILLIALLASRRTPLPRGWETVHHRVRPAASALVTVLLVAVLAGLAAAAYAAVGDDHPGRIAGAALLGAPNGVWFGVPIGLLVPFDGRATGVPAGFLPAPLGDLLSGGADRSVTLGRLAELDRRVWLLGVAAGLTMLLAGVLTAVRTPVGTTGGVRDRSALRFAGRCALRLGTGTALTLPLLAWSTGLSVDASLSVLGVDALGAGVELRGDLGMALVLGAVWGAVAGALGALLAQAAGAAGRGATSPAWGATQSARGAATGRWGGAPGTPGGPGAAGAPGTTGKTAAGPGTPGGPGTARSRGTPGGPGTASAQGTTDAPGTAGGPRTTGGPGAAGSVDSAGTVAGRSGASPYAARPGAPDASPSGPYTSGIPYRPPNPATNPYLRVPDGLREPQDAWPGEDAARHGDAQRSGPPPPADQPPSGERRFPGAPPASSERPSGEPSASEPPPGDGDVYGAPTVMRPIEPPPRSSRPPHRRGNRPASGADDVPPPPPPPPAPPPPRKPKGR